METKIYSSFKEINSELEILKLQKEIHEKKLSLSVDKTIDEFTPFGMIQNLFGNNGSLLTTSGLLKNVIIPFIIKKFIK